MGEGGQVGGKKGGRGVGERKLRGGRVRGS